MIEQLKTLEAAIQRIAKQYQHAQNELAELKKAPKVSHEEHTALKNKLASVTEERDTLKKNLQEFDVRYQSLAEAHHLIGEEQDKLQQQVDKLTAQNQTLQAEYDELKEENDRLAEKFRIANERTYVVLQRLTEIDEMED